MDTVTFTTDGSLLWPWTAYTLRTSFCHELGHALGQNHDANSPGDESCMNDTMTIFGSDGNSGSTSQIPGSHVGQSVNPPHSHNDQDCYIISGRYLDLAYRRLNEISDARLDSLLRGAVRIQAGPNKGKRLVTLTRYDDPRTLPAPEGEYRDVVYQQASEPSVLLGKSKKM